MKMKRANHIRRCRLCGCEDNFHNFLTIFEDNEQLELEKKITKLLPVVVMAWDPLPHTVCDNCIDKLNSFDDFYETTLKTERFLRSLLPSAPQNLETPNPVVQLMSSRTKEREDGVPLQNKNEKNPDGQPKRTLNCFIISPISSRESVYTCRKCYRTFTKESSALTHSCVRIENCGELETISGKGQKALPPLKIRLFCVKSGQYVCYLCRMPFEDKTKLVDHIKGHFLEGNLGEEEGKKCNKQKEKKKKRCTNRCDAYGELRPGRRKRKKCSGRRAKEADDPVGEYVHQMCEKCKNDHNCTTEEDTPEYRNSDADNSEPETEDKDDSKSIPLITLEDSDDSEEVTVLEDSIFRTISFFCPFCDRCFPAKDTLLAHQSIHLHGCSELTTVEGFLCSFCAEVFTSKKSLRAHEFAHDEERFGDLPPRFLR